MSVVVRSSPFSSRHFRRAHDVSQAPASGPAPGSKVSREEALPELPSRPRRRNLPSPCDAEATTRGQESSGLSDSPRSRGLALFRSPGPAPLEEMSGGLAPSKSTVYVSNLPFSLTNNDLYRIFSKYGKVVKVTIMKDKDTRKSKGVAFILFLDKDSAQNCTRAINNKQLFGRVIKASIAIDNGRAAEFIRRRNYFDKSKCYECGESGHLSYACPKNMLGEREPPKKKEKKKKKKIPEPEEEIEEVEESEDEGEDPALDSLSQAIAFQQARIEEEQRKWKPSSEGPSTSDDSRRPRIKKSTYFSDEEELSD